MGPEENPNCRSIGLYVIRTIACIGSRRQQPFFESSRIHSLAPKTTIFLNHYNGLCAKDVARIAPIARQTIEPPAVESFAGTLRVLART